MNNKDTEFTQQLEKLNNKNIEYGWCKSKLFGESKLTEDDDRVKNKEIEIFYVLRKANSSNAPYMIFFNGGPGVGFSDGFVDMLECETFFPNINVVCMDQRGTGCSSNPSDNLMELKYYTARYISYDAEQIRKKILGEDGKWLIFGESYGGHVVRKYVELYPENALSAISHGYGECSPVTMKVNIQLRLLKQLEDYFQRYPDDLKTIECLKSKLRDTDFIATEKRKVSGKYLVDIMTYAFGIFKEDDVHDMISKFNKENIVEEYIDKIGELARLLLNASGGKLNPVIAYIDLLGGMSDEVLFSKVDSKLKEIGFDPDNQVISQRRFAKGIDMIYEDPEAELLEKLLADDHFKADPVDMQKVINNLQKYKNSLHIFGSTNDPVTPVEAIHEEERNVKQLDENNYYTFHYSGGNHREWLYNNDMFSDILEEFLA